MEPLLPSSAGRRGGRWRDHRQVIEAIAWKYRTGSPWREVPESFGPWQTAYERLTRWSADGTWAKLLARAQADADAAEALRGRLVSRVVPDAELLPAAHALAAEIADNTSGVAVGAARQLLWSMLGAPTPWDAHRAETRALTELATGPDVAEGVAAFLAKRAPDFTAPLGDGDVAGVPRWPVPPADAEPPPR